jgi:uncharacterized protein YegP (UPF0339 family)
MSLNIRALAVLAALSISALAGCAAPTGDVEDVAETGDTGTQDLVSSSAYFESFKGLDGSYYFHLMAGNGENVLRSQGYTRLASADKGADSVLANGNDKRNFDLEQASNGDWYFNLVAANGETIGTSQLYSTKAHAERGARTVRALVRLLRAPASTTGAARSEKFEIFKGEDGQSYFRLRAANGEIMLSSEGYTVKASAQKGIASVKANGSSAVNYEVSEVENGGAWTVRLVAANGEVIGRTETYASKASAERAVTTLTTILSHRVDTFTITN